MSTAAELAAARSCPSAHRGRRGSTPTRLHDPVRCTGASHIPELLLGHPEPQLSPQAEERVIEPLAAPGGNFEEWQRPAGIAQVQEQSAFVGLDDALLKGAMGRLRCSF